MGEIIAFEEEFAGEVADLYVRVMRGAKGPAKPSLRHYLVELLLKNPWVSPDIRSLAYRENDRIVGFLGVIPREMEFEGRPIRVATLTSFVVDRRLHRGGAGISLLKHAFSGPQDLTYTDGAGQATFLTWTACGGHAARLYAFNWLRALRPAATMHRQVVGRKRGMPWIANLVLDGLTIPVDALLTRVGPFKRPISSLTTKLVTNDELFECIQNISWKEPLKPRYDRESFAWLIEHMKRGSSAAKLRTVVVSERDSRPAGWFVYTYRPSGSAYVLQIGCRRRDQFDAVLLALFQDAFQLGLSFVRGQSMPHHLVNLTSNQCLFRQPEISVLAHARDREILNTIHRGDAALSRLDGECWLRFASEEWS